jgi:Uma2 family endonuclease
MASASSSSLRHLRPARPLAFPSDEPDEEKLGESIDHLRLRTALWQILEHELAGRATAGSEQFVYFNARDPRRVCCPDAFVKLGIVLEHFPVIKVWEHGAPELVVEIVSKSDRERWSRDEKLARFHEAGVREVVFFDRKAREGRRIRVWDRIDDDLVERAVEGDRAPCVTLDLWWVVAPIERDRIALRLARDREGRVLLPTPNDARRAAERRVTELEARLARRTR